MDRLHTDREYEGELIALREKVLFMSASVETLLTAAVQAFHEQNPQKAKETSALDNQVDQLELEIDNACIHILARRQPVASDLRFITTALKLVTDLERIGDLATNICERVIEMGSHPVPAGAEEIEKMADISRNMLRDGLDSFVARDARRAQSVRERDHQVDQLYADLFPVVITRMAEQPTQCDQLMRVLSIAKYLERIADHATNLSEMVIFMIEGEDVRHLHKNTAS